MNNETISLATINNPWQPHASRETRAVLWHKGMTLADCAEQSGLAQIIRDYDGSAKLRAGVNGKTIEEEYMKNTEVKPGDSVVFAVEPMNGGGGGGGKNALAIVAMIAIVIVAAVVTFGVGAMLGPSGAWAWGIGAAPGIGMGAAIGGMVAGIAVGIGGAMMVQSLMPAAKTDLSKLGTGNWGEASQTYGWDLSRNLNREGLALAVIYGTMLVTPPVLASHVIADANGDQFLNLLMAVGEGELQLQSDSQYDNAPAVYLNGKHFKEYTRTYSPQPGTANVTNGGTAYADSVKDSSMPHYESYACDGNSGSSWLSNYSYGNHFWGYDFGVGKSRKVNRYKVYNMFGYNSGGNRDNGWTLVGFNTIGGAETTLHTVVHPPALNSGEEYSFANTQLFRFYEFRFVPSLDAQISEIELFEDITAGSQGTVQAMSINYNPGLNNQPAFSNFQRTYANVTGFNPVRLTSAFQSGETEGNAATVVGLFFSFPNGLFQVDDAGNVITESVSISIESRMETSPGVWGSWVAWDTVVVSAASNSTYSKYVEKANLTAGKYQARAKFTTAPSSSIRSSNACFWSALQTGLDDTFIYPNTAVLGLRAMATDQFNGGLPRVQCLVSRDTVSVRTSAEGVIPEVWENKAANNPAWACYDMLTNSRYGAAVSPDDVMIDDFATWAAYCENMTTYDAWQASHAYTLGQIIRSTGTTGNGWYYTCTQSGTTGGTEPTWATTTGGETTSGTAKFTAHKNYLDCNIAFDIPAGLVSALGDLAQTGRANVVQKGGKYGVIIDRPGLPVQMFTMGNIVAGSFKINYLDMSQRANVIEITYFDREREYQRSTVEVRTAGFDASTDTERNAPPIVLYGCTDRDQAIRHGRFMLLQNAYNRRVIEFEAGADAIACLPGDVINFSHDVPQWGYSGRVTAYNSGTQIVTLDRNVTFDPSPSYELQVRDQLTDTLQSVAVENPANAMGIPVTTNQVHVMTALGSGSVDAVYAFGVNGQSVKKYRVLAISRSQDRNHKITACEYDVAAYAEDTTAAPTATTSSLSGVYGLVTGEVDRNGSPYCLVSWQGASITFDVLVEKWNGATWDFALRSETSETWYEFAAAQNTRYRVTVSTVNPRASASSIIDIVTDTVFDFTIKCNRTYSDGKPAVSPSVSIGWAVKPARSLDGNVAFSSITGKDGSTGYGDFYSVCWPWKYATISQAFANDGGGIFGFTDSKWNLDYTNTDHGKLYLTVTNRGGGAYSVEAFKDSGRTQQVAHTANYTSPGGQMWIADNGSGIRGYVLINNLGSDTDIFVTNSLVPDYGVHAGTEWKYPYRWSRETRDSGNFLPWIIAITPATNAATCTLTWDSLSVPISIPGLKIVEVDPLGFMPISGATVHDMSVDSSITIGVITETKFYRIYFPVTEVTQTINLTSSPALNYICPTVYPQCPRISAFYEDEGTNEWNGPTQEFRSNDAYDILTVEPPFGLAVMSSSGSRSFTITGIPIKIGHKTHLWPGWNVIGYPTDQSALPTDTSIHGTWYKYKFGPPWYDPVTSLTAGKGYWVESTGGDININP